MILCDKHAPGLEVRYNGPRCPLCWSYEDEQRAADERDKYGRALNSIAMMIPQNKRPPPGDIAGIVLAVGRALHAICEHGNIPPDPDCGCGV